MTRALSSIFIFAALTMGFPANAQDEAPAPEETNKVVDGLRQGFWHIEGNNGKVDEGYYVDGKKHGKWKSLTIDGKVKSIVTYDTGKPRGEAIFYDLNGIETEHGFWNVDHWEGNYVRFHPNGQKACEFNYDNKGRRQGKQLYFHDNGAVMYEGNWQEGKIHGTLTAYDNQGHKILERNYNNEGKFESAIAVPINASAPPPRTFTGTGTYTLYNMNGKVDRKGNFVKGDLIDGERYVYREDGSLNYIEVYKDGEVTKRK